MSRTHARFTASGVASRSLPVRLTVLSLKVPGCPPVTAEVIRRARRRTQKSLCIKSIMRATTHPLTWGNEKGHAADA